MIFKILAAAAAGYATFQALKKAGEATVDGSQSAPADDSSSGTGALLDQGVASFYGPTGNLTANGEVYDGTSMTAAHRTLPFNTVVEVVDVDTGATVEVRINDRGPAAKTGRVIDLSLAAADALGIRTRGLANVEVRAVA